MSNASYSTRSLTSKSRRRRRKQRQSRSQSRKSSRSQSRRPSRIAGSDTRRTPHKRETIKNEKKYINENERKSRKEPSFIAAAGSRGTGGQEGSGSGVQGQGQGPGSSDRRAPAHGSPFLPTRWPQIKPKSESRHKRKLLRRKKRKRREKFAKWKKYTVYATSGVIFITGIIMIIFGSKSLEEQRSVQFEMNMTFHVMAVAKISSVVLVSYGITSIFAAAIGSLGAFYNSRYALGVYCMIIFILFATMLGLGIIAQIVKSYPRVLEAQLRETMVLYRTKHIKRMWDDLHLMFNCCGLTDKKGVYEWKTCFREMIKSKGLESWKQFPGIRDFPKINKYELPENFLQYLFPFMYPKWEDYDEDDDQYQDYTLPPVRRRRSWDNIDDRFRSKGNLTTKKPSTKKPKPTKKKTPKPKPTKKKPKPKKNKTTTTEPPPPIGNGVEELLNFFQNDKGAQKRIRNYFNFVPETCCVNPIAWQNYNSTTIKKNRTVCAFQNKSHVWQDGCVKKIQAKFQRVSTALFFSAILMMMAIIAATFVVVTPDKYLKGKK